MRMYPINLRTRHRGLTLVDLCVVCAASALLVLLLVPAVAASRRSARRGQCKNNLKEIGLALHNYHDVFRVFPPGWVTAYQDGDSHPGFGWQAFILPYMDKAPLFNRIRFEKMMPAPEENDGLLRVFVEEYLCQETDAHQTNKFRGDYAISTYSGNYGSYRPPRWSDGRVEAFWPGAVPAAMNRRSRYSPRSRPNIEQPRNFGHVDGMFSWNSSVRIADVSDGSSNTLMVSERGKRSEWGIWPGVGSNRFQTDQVTDASHQSPINKSLSGFSSGHNGGIYLLLVDGSVRFVADDIESKPEGGVLQAIASRNGQEVFSDTVYSKEKLDLF